MCDIKFSYYFTDNCKFNGTKIFYPFICNGALFFKDIHDSHVYWWHGWLSPVPLLAGFSKIGGNSFQFIKVNNHKYISVEKPGIIAMEWESHNVALIDEGIIIDIGGERVKIW
jgi:hypothetical protein